MYAKIIKDHINCSDELGPEFEREGLVIAGSQEEQEGELYLVNLYDDDDILYYQAYSDDDGFEPLFDFTSKDAGVTRLAARQDGVWEDIIA